MQFDIVTIFPDFFSGPLDYGVVRRAREAQLVDVRVHDLRTYAHDRHRTVDDRPFGGGDGMVLKPEPLFRAVEWIQDKSRSRKTATVFLTPQGRRFDQQMASRFAEFDQVILICGRYEGIDQR